MLSGGNENLLLSGIAAIVPAVGYGAAGRGDGQSDGAAGRSDGKPSLFVISLALAIIIQTINWYRFIKFIRSGGSLYDTIVITNAIIFSALMTGVSFAVQLKSFSALLLATVGSLVVDLSILAVVEKAYDAQLRPSM